MAVFLQGVDSESDAEGFGGADGGAVDGDDGFVEGGDAATLGWWWG